MYGVGSLEGGDMVTDEGFVRLRVWFPVVWIMGFGGFMSSWEGEYVMGAG